MPAPAPPAQAVDLPDALAAEVQAACGRSVAPAVFVKLLRTQSETDIRRVIADLSGGKTKSAKFALEDPTGIRSRAVLTDYGDDEGTAKGFRKALAESEAAGRATSGPAFGSLRTTYELNRFYSMKYGGELEIAAIPPDGALWARVEEDMRREGVDSHGRPLVRASRLATAA